MLPWGGLIAYLSETPQKESERLVLGTVLVDPIVACQCTVSQKKIPQVNCPTIQNLKSNTCHSRLPDCQNHSNKHVPGLISGVFQREGVTLDSWKGSSKVKFPSRQFSKANNRTLERLNSINPLEHSGVVCKSNACHSGRLPDCQNHSNQTCNEKVCFGREQPNA